MGCQERWMKERSQEEEQKRNADRTRRRAERLGALRLLPVPSQEIKAPSEERVRCL